MTETKEVWKITEDGNYRVSNLGNIERHTKSSSNAAVPGKRLRPGLAAKKYMQIKLHFNGMGHRFHVHRLVAGLFIGPLPNGKQVNHKDGNKKNNAASNLEYVSASENVVHAYRSGLMKSGEKHPLAKLTNAQVRHIRSLYAKGGVVGIVKLAKLYGVNNGTISRAGRGLSYGLIDTAPIQAIEAGR